MRKFLMSIALITTVLSGTYYMTASPAYAACASCITKVGLKSFQWWWETPGGTVSTVNKHTMDKVTDLKEWVAATWWGQNVFPAMQYMADEISAVTMQQAFIIGTFFDASHQMDTMQALQVIKARAHKDYHPSTGMCQFGTATQSLASAEAFAQSASVSLSQLSLDRQLGMIDMPTVRNDLTDKNYRIAQFKKTYCDPADNANGLNLMCEHDGGVGAVDKGRINKDIDFARTVDAAWTLNFTGDDGDPEVAEDLYALSTNLYGHNLFRRPPDLTSKDDRIITPTQRSYLNMRSHLAKRGVAENSFNAMAAMRVAGSEESLDYLGTVLEELGVDPAEIGNILGQKPSYYAQMEILTKKLYQNPDFYTNLYDKPANVMRKEVAMQAIGLMQKFDSFKSYLRSEASLSVLLELAVTDLQNDAETALSFAPSETIIGN
jgi:hypothetical protein